ncbi:MAG: ABC transporter ATP-binding protein/permease [Rhodothermaceae bacterium]|nr:ABC transporter ATP-binding protein/permease [Rhodothermaceae bacterium]
MASNGKQKEKKQQKAGSGARFEKKEEKLSTKERFEALRYIPPFLKMIWAASPSMAIANLLLRLVRAGLPLALLYVGKLIIDEVVRLVNLGGVESSELQTIWTLIAIELGLAVLSDVLGRAVTLLDALLGDKFTNDISVKLIQHAATLDLIHFEDAEFYDKLERARQQTYSRHALMSMVFKQLQDVVTITFLAAGLIVMAPWLILLLAVALIPAFLGEAHFNARSYSLIRNWTEERRELDYLRYVGASDVTAKEVKIFGLSRFLSNRYGELADEYYLANRNLSIKRASWGGALAIVGSLGYYIAYVIIVWRTVQGQFSIGDLTFLAGSFSRLRGLLEAFLTGFTRIAERALYLKDLFDFFDIQARILPTSNSLPVPSPIKEGFRFENVGFRYPGSEQWALRNLSFTLNTNEIIALVGENGAGKTTLVKLLARLYDPDEGIIYLDGKDLKLYDIEGLRNKVGVIFQDYVRYALSASDNIAVGRIAERDDRERIVESADLSLARPVIERLPDQFEQVLGKRFSNGTELSGGQWQKVALGRAYMRNAELLILDEPTAALDARAEYEVFQRFVDLTRGKMAVLISHRFSTVRMAHRILVLENGVLIEEGSHEALLELNGRYAELFMLQAEGYR